MRRWAVEIRDATRHCQHCDQRPSECPRASMRCYGSCLGCAPGEISSPSGNLLPRRCLVRHSRATSSLPALRNRAIGENHCQQRSGQQQSPESDHHAEQDRHDQRRPDGHSRGAPHDERLQNQAVQHDDHAVEPEHPEKALQASADERSHRWPNERQHRSEVRNELKQRQPAPPRMGPTAHAGSSGRPTTAIRRRSSRSTARQTSSSARRR